MMSNYPVGGQPRAPGGDGLGANEMQAASVGLGEARRAILSLGLLLLVATWAADIYYSAVPLQEAIAPAMAWIFSILSSPLEIAAEIYVLRPEYRQRIGRVAATVWAVLGATLYIYDMATNYAGLGNIAVAEHGIGLAPALAAIIRVAISVFMAFAEFFIEHIWAALRGAQIVVAGRGQ